MLTRTEAAALDRYLTAEPRVPTAEDIRRENMATIRNTVAQWKAALKEGIDLEAHRSVLAMDLEFLAAAASALDMYLDQ